MSRKHVYLLKPSDEINVTNASAVANLVNSYSLDHGDIVQFSDYRGENAYFVCKGKASDDNGNVKLILPEDETCSGYHTFPLEITESLNNPVEQYKEILKDISFALMRLTPIDPFIVQVTGDCWNDNWQFAAHFVEGELEELHVKAGGEWECIPTSCSKELIARGLRQRYIEQASSPLVEFSLQTGRVQGIWTMASFAVDLPSWRLEFGGGDGKVVRMTFSGRQSEQNLLATWLDKQFSKLPNEAFESSKGSVMCVINDFRERNKCGQTKAT